MTKGSNSGLPHCKRLSQPGKPRLMIGREGYFGALYSVPLQYQLLLLFHVFLCFYYFCFWLHWIFVAGHWLCLVTESKGYCSCGLWPSHCGDFCCGAQALGPLASALVAHGHSCSGLCCLPCPRIELISPALTGDSYPLYQQGSPLPLVYLGFLFFFFGEHD